MNRFALPHFTAVVLENINARAENHGDETVAALDLKLSVDAHNSVLDLFRPGLRKWLYFKSSTPRDSPDDEQGRLDLDEPNDLPDLRFPELGVLRWQAELTGRTLTIEHGIGGPSNIRLTDVKVNEFRLECREGGTVRVSWRVQRTQPDEAACGKLLGLLKHEVRAMLVGSPETESLLAQEPSDAVDEAMAWPFAQSVGAANGVPLDATEEFVAQHGKTGANDHAHQA